MVMTFSTLIKYLIGYTTQVTESKYVTVPAKTGHVGTNNTLSHYRSYLSSGTKYLHSLTCIV